MSEVTVADIPCEVCGCHLVDTFTCGCGACRDDHYCGNCGRMRPLPKSGDRTLIEPLDARCEHGAVAHKHSVAEKSARVRAFYKSLPSEEELP